MSCKCGHELALHHHGRSCTGYSEGFKFCKCEEFREVDSENRKGETVMAKKPHTLLVVRYEPAAKDGSELLNKENTSQSATMYRALAAAKEPLTIKECYAACEGKMESTAAWERLGKNLNSTLFALRKAGFVKKSERREEVEAKPRAAKKANGAPNPKRVKAPRKPRALRPATAEAQSESAA